METDPLSSAPAKKWQPYGGYDPKNRGAPAASSAPAAMSAPAYSAPASAAPAYSAPESSGPVAMTNAPAKKWVPYGGYDPKNRGAPAASKPWSPPVGYAPSAAAAPAPLSNAEVDIYASSATKMTNAPDKKWQPYGGYDPKSRR